MVHVAMIGLVTRRFTGESTPSGAEPDPRRQDETPSEPGPPQYQGPPSRCSCENEKMAGVIRIPHCGAREELVVAGILSVFDDGPVVALAGRFAGHPIDACGTLPCSRFTVFLDGSENTMHGQGAGRVVRPSRVRVRDHIGVGTRWFRVVGDPDPVINTAPVQQVLARKPDQRPAAAVLADRNAKIGGRELGRASTSTNDAG